MIMHAVIRSSEPEFFDAIRCRYDSWGELYGTAGEQIRQCRNRHPSPCCVAHLVSLDGEQIRREIRAALRRDFFGICGYCEQDCANTETVIEHFRPRDKFPDEWITWLNLVYACRRCDERKGDSWPSESNDYDESLSYVNPSLRNVQKPAEEFFDFCIADDAGDTAGTMRPSQYLTPGEWWQADRTIVDFDLNSDSNAYSIGQERLPYLRNEHLDWVIEHIESEIGDLYADLEATRSKLLEFTQPDQPFSSYVAAFARLLGV